MLHPSHFILARLFAESAGLNATVSHPAVNTLAEIYDFLAKTVEMSLVPTELAAMIQPAFRARWITTLSPDEWLVRDILRVQLAGLRLFLLDVEATDTTRALETILGILEQVLVDGHERELVRYRDVLMSNRCHRLWVYLATL